MDLSKLSGTEYQKLIFERLIHKLFPDHRVLAVEDYAQGAVDYIVREHPGTGMLSADRFHYFECKNYSRQLELDNVAKIMVVAVADQPSTVHVVSRTGLQPQIKKYAARIFNVDGNSSPIFRGITFRHWITEEIGDFRKTDMGYGEEDQPHGDGGLWWWISECSAFAETEISSWSSPRREITLRHGSLLILTLESRELQAATIEVQGIPQACWTPIIAEDGTAASARHSYLIDTAEFEFDRVYTVTVKMARGVADTRIPIGYFQVHAADVYLPELRSAEINRLVSEIGSSGQFRLILVDGEAGVGKTHLIERVAEELRAKAGFDVMRLTVSEENCEGLMGALLHGCLAPPIGRGGFQELADALQKILIHQAGGETRETDISLLARVATGMGPRVIVLRDCHHLTAAVASEIWTLIMALDDASWGGVRLVLEYRQPDAQLNAALQTLIHKARLNIRKVLLERPVSPLDETQFASMARRLFTDVTDDLIRSLRQRTGGLPLFIDSYLRRLSHLGLIVRQKGQEPFFIAQPAQVLADALPTDGQVILEERVRTWLRNAFGEGDEESAVVIGLLAMADDGRGQALMRTALGLSEDEVKAVQKRLEDGEIAYGRLDGQILFRHDLLRIAAITVASGYDSFSLRAGQVARELLGDGEATGNAVLIHSLRIRIFSQLADSVALETELRTGARAAKEAGNYGRLISFLTQLLALLKDRSNVGERLDLMKELAWATWVSDSLLAARERYVQLAKAAESCMEGDFSIADAAATDAYRRAIGIDLELMEPLPFLQNTINVLCRRQTHITFNSILNRLVLFCARFGYPQAGHDFAQLAFGYIGTGYRENEGSVLFSELGAMYAQSDPDTALPLLERALAMAMDDCERCNSTLGIMVTRCLHQGREIDLGEFGHLWTICTENRYSETLARASLLRGSLLLRKGDLDQAAYWISRTSVLVRLYHLKEFHLAVLSDQVVLALLQANQTAAEARFAELLAEFVRIDGQLDRLSPLVAQAYEAAARAAATLVRETSTFPRPAAPPAFCDLMSEMRGNVSALASILGQGEVAERFRLPPASPPHPISPYRQVAVQGVPLILGAY